MREAAANPGPITHEAPALATSAANPAAGKVTTQSCPSCVTARAVDNGPGAASSYVYALGKITPRFPTPSVEKEFAQIVGRDDTKGLTDPQLLHKILSERHNRYLVRKLCWMMTIEGLETYILVPRDPADFDLLVETVRGTPQPADRDLVIGLKGSIAPPEMCNGLMVPIVVFDQIYSFDRDTLIKSIPKPEKTSTKEPIGDVHQQVPSDLGLYLTQRVSSVHCVTREPEAVHGFDAGHC